MYLLFDIGGTKTRVALCRDGKTIQDHDVQIFPTLSSFNEGIDKITSIGKELSGEEKIIAVCGGIAGPLDRKKEFLANDANKATLTDWKNRLLKNELQKTFDCNVFLENDSIMGALGVAVFGIGKDHRIVAFINIGTGVGGAKIVDGKVSENVFGFEPGWQIIDPAGTLCPECGPPPHNLGLLIDGKNIKKRTGKNATEIEDVEFWNKFSKVLAIGIHNTIVYWSPDVVILGGSISKDLSLDKLNKDLEKLPYPFEEKPEIKKAVLDDKTGLFGALAYLQSKDA